MSKRVKYLNLILLSAVLSFAIPNLFETKEVGLYGVIQFTTPFYWGLSTLGLFLLYSLVTKKAWAVLLILLISFNLYIGLALLYKWPLP